jgi:hypothetical protein
MGSLVSRPGWNSWSSVEPRGKPALVVVGVLVDDGVEG